MYSQYGIKLNRYFSHRKNIPTFPKQNNPKLTIETDIFTNIKKTPHLNCFSPSFNLELIKKRNRLFKPKKPEIIIGPETKFLTDFDKIVLQSEKIKKTRSYINKTHFPLKPQTKRENSNDNFYTQNYLNTLDIHNFISMDKMRPRFFHVKSQSTTEGNFQMDSIETSINFNNNKTKISSYYIKPKRQLKEDKITTKIFPRQIMHNLKYESVFPKTVFNFVNYDKEMTQRGNSNYNCGLRKFLFDKRDTEKKYTIEHSRNCKLIPFIKTIGRTTEEQDTLPMFMFNINSGMRNVCLTERMLRENNFYTGKLLDPKELDENIRKRGKALHKKKRSFEFREIKKQGRYRLFIDHAKKMKGYYEFNAQKLQKNLNEKI